MKIRAVVVSALVATLLSVPGSVTAGTNFTGGIIEGLRSIPSSRGSLVCTPTARVWSQELRKSGVDRLRARFELKGPYAEGWLPSYSKTEWMYTARFPDDINSYNFHWTLRPDVLTFGNGKQVAIWAKLIGERPSFWKPDLKFHFKVGVVGCDGVLDPGGGGFEPGTG